MNKSGVFLVIFILLLGGAVLPTGPIYSATQIEPSSSANTAALATTGTLKVKVAEDTGVLNGSYASMNFGGDAKLYLGTGDEGTWVAARSYFKFDLVHLPSELSIQRATMNVFIAEEWSSAGGVDEPVGVYYCQDNSWEQMVITWNTQPTFSSTPSDIIDSPASPDMFIEGNWYSWEVTPDVRTSLADDKILSEVLKYTEEVGTQNSFMYPMKSETYPFNATYLEIEYTAPTTTGLSVDGISSGPLLDYINNPHPELGWTFSDPDYNDFQKDYDVELWNNTYFNDTMLWQDSHEQISIIHESGDTGGNYHPFGYADPFRLQMKFPGSELPRSGVVDKLYFTTNDAGDLRMENLEVSLLMVPSTADLTADFNANYEGQTPTIVLSRDIFEVSVINNTIEIDVEDIFFLNEYLNLIIEIRLTNNTGDLVRLARTSSGPGSVAANWGDSEALTSSYTPPARTYDLKIGFLTESVFEDSMGSWNGFPFGVTIGTPGRFQIKYNQSYVNRAGYLDKMYFRVNTLTGDVVYENFTISLVETPILGPIDHIDWTSNYGGNNPVVVLDESMYTVRNIGHALVIDFDNTFYYSNTHDLLIDFQWDSKVSGSAYVNYLSGHTSSYRAWDLHWNAADRLDNGTAGYNLLLDFVNSENSVPLEASVTLTNATWYYLRVRICDNTGVWSDWTTLDFKYEVITSLPSFSQPVAVPDPARVGQEATISLNVTHSLGINEVSIEFDGTNHTMTVDGDTFSYTWTPTVAGTLNYTVYMQSNANTWNSVESSLLVQAPAGGLGDMTLILVMAGAAVVIVVILVVVLKKKPAK